jgi:hypothetical protein
VSPRYGLLTLVWLRTACPVVYVVAVAALHAALLTPRPRAGDARGGLSGCCLRQGESSLKANQAHSVICQKTAIQCQFAGFALPGFVPYLPAGACLATRYGSFCFAVPAHGDKLERLLPVTTSEDRLCPCVAFLRAVVQARRRRFRASEASADRPKPHVLPHRHLQAASLDKMN